MLGNDVDIFDAGVKPGGLNEWLELQPTKPTDNFAQDEIEWLLQKLEALYKKLSPQWKSFR